MAKKKALVDFNSEGNQEGVFRQPHGGFEDWISLQSRPEAETSSEDQPGLREGPS